MGLIERLRPGSTCAALRCLAAAAALVCAVAASPVAPGAGSAATAKTNRAPAITPMVTPAAAAGTATIEKVRAWPAPEHTRIVFDTSAPVEHTVFRLGNPERLVIDLVNARLKKPSVAAVGSDNQVRGMRAAARGGSGLRVVLDLKRPVRARSFALKPNPPHGHRLVVDLRASAAEGKVAKGEKVSTQRRLRNVVIAIDPGHGGVDPGAIGPKKIREKDVVLQIARQLADELARMRGFKPVLTRTGDQFLRLRTRIERARKARADLFVSIHADAFRDRRVKGSSVYVLSRNGASSEAAKWLADQENASDLVGGVRLDDKDGLLASVLLDLSQAATLSASGAAASRILKEMHGLGKLHKRDVQRAGFVVLKSPDIPSILIETGFISNPIEERRLRARPYQRKLARAIAHGIRGYFENNAPEGTLLAARRHVISRGETLSHISHQYQVSLDVLRTENRLRNDRLKVGQVLRIPG